MNFVGGRHDAGHHLLPLPAGHGHEEAAQHCHDPLRCHLLHRRGRCIDKTW